MRDGEHALLQGGGDLGVAKRQWCSAQAGRAYLQRAIDAAQRRADRFGADGCSLRAGRRGPAPGDRPKSSMPVLRSALMSGLAPERSASIMASIAWPLTCMLPFHETCLTDPLLPRRRPAHHWPGRCQPMASRRSPSRRAVFQLPAVLPAMLSGPIPDGGCPMSFSTDPCRVRENRRQIGLWLVRPVVGDRAPAGSPLRPPSCRS